MFASVPAIPRWLSALDERKPYVEVLDGERIPPVSPRRVHGQVVSGLIVQIGRWAEGRGSAGTEVRYYFWLPSGRWSSLLPDVCYTSAERLPPPDADEWDRPRVAPDLAIEVLSPDDRPGRTRQKVDTYLAFGATAVLVVDPEVRRATIHRAGGGVEQREARGSWPLEPFDGLVLDWDDVFAQIAPRRAR
jgi:Uma2 family endonuclease